MKTQKATYLKVSMSEYSCFTGGTEQSLTATVLLNSCILV